MASKNPLASIGAPGYTPPNPLSTIGSPASFAQQGRMDSAELLRLAQLEGGAVAEAANELVNPRTSILSTVGSGLKNALKGFIDVISTPSEVVAGIISKKYTVGEAIKENIRPSDVIFGKKDKNATTMQKVGSFFVRTATDILLDPLTYVTFGQGQGILGLRALPRVQLGEAAAKKMGVEAFTNRALSKEGADLFKFLKGLEYQKNGITVMKDLDTIAKGGGELFELAGKELDDVLKVTIDAPLNMDYAKKALSNLLEHSPQLTETLLDKGGIKFFGKSILSGQRISATKQLIPGMTALDDFTRPYRMALQAPFDPSLVKTANGWKRLPEEYLNLENAAKGLQESMQGTRVKSLVDIVRANKLSVDEANLLTAAVEAKKLPADARLANAYKQFLGFGDEEYKFLQKSGIPISYRDGHVPHILLKEDMPGEKSMGFLLPPKQKVEAAIERKVADTVAEGRALGFNFDENIVTAHLKRTLDNIDSGVSHRFMREAASTMGMPKSSAPAGWRGISVKGVTKQGEELLKIMGKEGDEMVFHPAVAERMEKFIGSVISDDATKDVLQYYDKVQNLWKASVTSIFPAFHGRNAISNVFMNFMDLGHHSINPVNHAMSGQMIMLDRKANALARAASGIDDLAPEAVEVGAAIGRHIDSARQILNTLPADEFSKLGGMQALLKRIQTNIVDGISDKTIAESVKNVSLDGMNSIDDFAKAISGFIPKGKATKAGEELADILQKVVFTDAVGHPWTFGELRQVLKNNNVAFNKNVTGALDVTLNREETISSLFPEYLKGVSKAKAIAKKALPVSQDFVPFEVGREVGRAVEEQARILNFVANLRNTGDVTMAANRTKQFLFDYQALTGFEKTVMRRLIPFYTFTRKNLELQARSLLTTPGRVAAEVTAITNLGDVIAGGELTDEERNALPSWIKSSISILRKKDGPLVEIYGSLGTPIEQPFQMMQPNNLFGSLSPLIRLPLETGSGYSFFHGKPLSEVTNAAAFKSAPKVVQDFIGFTEVKAKRKDGSDFTMYVALRPERMNLVLNLPPTSRVLSALKQMESADVSTQSKILQQLVGIRPYAFDLDLEAEKRENELRKELEDLLTNARVTAKYQRVYIPKGQ